ncbi:hypothetical protein AKJ64_03130 [candidate division MSBL1 archaeon SCGC-AAA259E17]|uniref:Tyr recombinase domain-containing protein n=1 Tax=candidate division MSBL1 archaeon SCGC-AAA259E17 TaxID=1698263 RepID=A0A133UE02_9EURY|nr:hypothetical protein AKJ64_03130 [candidate division MSBL1 archaeon SCGC-AAA259E17]
MKFQTKRDLQKHYNEIVNKKYLLFFLVKATSGLHLNEIVSLTMNDIDFDKRRIITDHDSRTKRSHVSFYNLGNKEGARKVSSKKSKWR